MTKGIKQLFPLKPNTQYTISAIVSGATTNVAPVAKTFSTSFAEGSSTTLAKSVWLTSGGTITAISFTGLTHFTAVLNAAAQTITLTPTSQTFVGNDTGTFTVTDSNSLVSSAVAFSVTTTAVIVTNNNLVINCKDFTTSNWLAFNSPTVTISGTLVTDPNGGTTAQQLTFPTNRAGLQYAPDSSFAAGTYTASMFIKVPSVVSGQQIMLSYYHSDFPTTQNSSVFVPTAAWTRVQFTFTIAAGDSPTSILMQNINGDNTVGISASETIYVWGFEIEAGSSATTFVDCASQPLPVANNVTATVTTAVASTIPPNVTNKFSSIAITTNPTRGTGSVSGSNMIYTSSAGVTGADSMKYTATNASGTSAPATVSLTVSANSTGLLPTTVLLSFYQNYSGENDSIADLMTNAPEYNVLAWVTYTGSGSGDGHLISDGGSITAAEITAWKNSGRVALVQVDSRNFTCTTTTHVNNFLSDIEAVINTYGFQGLMFDWEDTFSTTTKASAISIAQALKTKYGDNFVIAMAPRSNFYADFDAWADVATTLGAKCDLVCGQEYDWGSAGSDPAGLIVTDLTRASVLALPHSKLIMIGETPFTSPTNATQAQYVTALTNLRNNHQFRGGGVWQSFTDKQNGYAMAHAFKTALGI